MKTSEIKNFALQSPMRPTKLKFTETKTSFNEQVFTEDDSKNASFICKCLKELKQQGKPLTKYAIELNYELMLKLLKHIEQQRGPDDPNKIKFRIVRSAKKPNQNQEHLEESSELWQKKPIKLKPLSISQSKSQVFFNKENITLSEYPAPGEGITGITEKNRMKKLPEIKGLEMGRTMEKQKIRLKSHTINEQNIRKELQIARQKQYQKTEQNKKLRSMLLQIQNSQPPAQPLQIPFKILLQYDQNPQQDHHQTLTIPLSPLPQNSTPSTQSLFKQQISQLQLLNVCQSIEIENLQQKLVEEQRSWRKTNGKKDRWNYY